MFYLKYLWALFFQYRRDFVKKAAIFVTFFIINTFLIISTAIAQEQTSKAEKGINQTSALLENKEIILKLFHEVINLRNVSYFDQVYVPNAIDHSAWPGQAPGTAGIKQAVKEFLETFSELKVTVEDVIAEGNKVATRETWKGTHTSTGKAGSGSVIHIFWIQDGKVTEEWSRGWDWADKL
jgi:predicted SnoaL-like aldol condensation-catalyzing enzyme